MYLPPVPNWIYRIYLRREVKALKEIAGQAATGGYRKMMLGPSAPLHSALCVIAGFGHFALRAISKRGYDELAFIIGTIGTLALFYLAAHFVLWSRRYNQLAQYGNLAERHVYLQARKAELDAL